jgi:hypothetical protein
MAPRRTKLEPFELTDLGLRSACDTFIRLIADHGIFNIAQLFAYVTERVGRVLTRAELRDVVAYMEGRGARHGWGKKPDLFRIPVRRKSRGLPKGKRDKRTLDLFAPQAGE